MRGEGLTLSTSEGVTRAAAPQGTGLLRWPPGRCLAVRQIRAIGHPGFNVLPWRGRFGKLRRHEETEKGLPTALDVGSGADIVQVLRAMVEGRRSGSCDQRTK